VFYSPRQLTDFFHRAAHQSTAWRIFIQAKTSNVCAPQIDPPQNYFHNHIKINKMQLNLPSVFLSCIFVQPTSHPVLRGQQVFRALRRKIRGQHINFYSQVIHNAEKPIKSVLWAFPPRPHLTFGGNLERAKARSVGLAIAAGAYWLPKNE
jgi:hypothetical protein